MRAVTFDLWHTLVYITPEEEDLYMETQLAIGRRALMNAPRDPGGAPDRSESELGRAFEEAYLTAVEEADRGRSVPPAEQLRAAGARTGRRPSLNGYLAELERAVNALHFHATPGALSLLRSLSDDGYRLAVISNTVGEPGAFLRPILGSMGFDRYIASYTFSDEHPWSKPAPEIFRAALDEHAVRPFDVVHVGDGWSDIEGARRAGLRAGILYSGAREYGRRYQELFGRNDRPGARAEYEATDLGEVGELVRTLLPAR